MSAKERRGNVKTHAAMEPFRRNSIHGCILKLRNVAQKRDNAILEAFRDRDVFGGRVPRFRMAWDDAPGPGTYDPFPTGMIWDNQSLSTKGYGSLVSKNRRFELANDFFYPGPGKTHSVHRFFKQNAKRIL